MADRATDSWGDLDSQRGVEYDGFGARLLPHQLGERLDDETRRRLLERIDEGKA